ncbi:MAG: HypC/HybG/HupF family hydrogenase formation chaperone [Candidatus Aureabacteria bacterium]|nr:HypC/HybG/HupF family hydrogenase formation chaperone [Candidatus Auribacterota bacterium]
MVKLRVLLLQREMEMCVAVPGEIIELIADGHALVDFGGVRKRVALDLIEHAMVGDFVIVHAGFAINTLNREEALETIEYFKQLSEPPGQF